MKIKTIVILWFCLIGISNANDIHIENSWIAAAPPNARMLAAYMTIVNSGDQDRSLVRITSSHAKSVEVHQTLIENGIAKMREVKPLVIPAGRSVKLEPGSYHLMLFAASSLRVNQNSQFVLIFDDGTEIQLSTVVRRRGAH